MRFKPVFLNIKGQATLADNNFICSVCPLNPLDFASSDNPTLDESIDEKSMDMKDWLYSCTAPFFFFFGQRSNLPHSINLSHSSDSSGSLIARLPGNSSTAPFYISNWSICGSWCLWKLPELPVDAEEALYTYSCHPFGPSKR